jgi:hypothetical protein
MSLRPIRLILVPTDFSPASVDPADAGGAAENIFPPRLLFESVIAETRRRLDRVVAHQTQFSVRHCDLARSIPYRQM